MSLLKHALPAALVILSGCHAVAPKDASYSVGTIYPVAGAGGWDLMAVDPQRAHLFLSRSDRVQVLDTRDGHLAGTIPGTDHVHGIAVVESLRRGYTTNGGSNSVTEFDLDTLQRIRDISVNGQSPDAILYDGFSHRVFVFNAHSNNASVIDPSSGREIATIPFDGNPELAASDGKGRVFVNIEDKAEIAEIDAAAMRVTQTWPLPGCEEPSGLALDAAHARLFSVCQNGSMAVTDAASGHQVGRVPIGEGPDGAAFDPASQTVFSPNGHSGTLTIVHEDDPNHFRVLQTLATQDSARTIVLDSTSHRLYLPAASFSGQPAPGQRRPPMVPDSFRVLMVAAARH